MIINDELIKKISVLARLEVHESENESLKNDMQKIINYFEILDEIDTSQTLPMYTPIESNAQLRRTDNSYSECADRIIQNFPEKEGRLFKVPSIYGKLLESQRRTCNKVS